MSVENDLRIIQVRDEWFELPASLFDQLHQISFDVDPCIFHAYLLYIQSDCFIRPQCSFHEDFISGLRICGAPAALINHCELSSTFTSRSSPSRSSQLFLDALILTSLIISACILAIDLYRQVLIFNETSPRALVLLVYLIDGALFLYSSGHAIAKFITNARLGQRTSGDLNFLTDIISSLGVLCYFISQRPMHFFRTFIHLCRTARLIQLGYHLFDIQWCLRAIGRSLDVFIQTLLGLFWIFIFSGSILYLIDVLEKNEQYSSIFSTILSAHETLYTIGYRNNAPRGRWTRLWTMLSIYFLSSLVQILCWWFQTNVMIHWRK